MDLRKRIGLFLSGPSDVNEILNSVKIEANSFNKSTGSKDGFYLETVNWVDDVYSSKGADAQDVINKQSKNKYDILIAVIWKKLGTPTKREESGTVEEIKNAINDTSKKHLIYFNNDAESLKDIDYKELSRINEFKSYLEDEGVKYSEFHGITEFERLLRIHLPNCIHDFVTSKTVSNSTEDSIQIEKLNKDNYEDIEFLISEVENGDKELVNIDLFELEKNAHLGLQKLTNTTSVLTEIMNEYSEMLNENTSEINKYYSISDARLREKKLKTYFDAVSIGLDNFSSKTQLQIPEFRDSVNSFIDSFSKIRNVQIVYKLEPDRDLVKSLTEFRDGYEFAVRQTAELLKGMREWIPINRRFNTAKNRAELTIKELTKEMLAGLRVIDELLPN